MVFGVHTWTQTKATLNSNRGLDSPWSWYLRTKHSILRGGPPRPRSKYGWDTPSRISDRSRGPCGLDRHLSTDGRGRYLPDGREKPFRIRKSRGREPHILAFWTLAFSSHQWWRGRYVLRLFVGRLRQADSFTSSDRCTWVGCEYQPCDLSLSRVQVWHGSCTFGLSFCGSDELRWLERDSASEQAIQPRSTSPNNARICSGSLTCTHISALHQERVSP